MSEFFKKYLFLIILLSIALTAYFLPIRFNYSFETYAKILPVRQWILLRGSDGFLLEGVKNIQSGINNFYRVNQFDRGATIEVNLHPELESGSYINKGDTLGIIYSSANYEKYIALQGQIKTAKAQLEVITSGEKESVVRSAEENLSLAESEEDKQQKITDRLKVLNEKGLASDEEYQLAADNLRSLKLRVQVQKSELESVRSGSKESEINQLKTYISSLTNDLKSVEKQIASFHLTAPFTGQLERVFSTDTLLILTDADSFLAAIPIPVEDEVYLDENSIVSLFNDGNEIEADIIHLSNTVSLVSGKQCVTLLASVKNSDAKLFSGLIVKSDVTGKSLTLREYFKVLLY